MNDLEHIADLCLNYNPPGQAMAKELREIKCQLEDLQREIRFLNSRLDTLSEGGAK